MLPFLSLLTAVALLVVLRVRLERAKRRALSEMVEGDPQALQGQYHLGTSTVVYLDPQVKTSVDEESQSPYRRDANAPDETDGKRRARARAALRNARWLLIGAVYEAEEAARLTRLGQLRRADAHTTNQNKAELDAAQCIFEAEDWLDVRIVREPGEPPTFARFYGKAAQMLESVTGFLQKAFPDDAATG